MFPLLREVEDLGEVLDAKSTLKSRNSTAGGSVEVCVDGAEVNTLGDHGNGLTNNLDNVVKAKVISGLGADSINKADKLGSQSDGVRESSLDLEINGLASSTMKCDCWAFFFFF